jgi:adenylate kinase
MDQGRLVPDSVVIGLVRDKLADPDYAKGFILDGFPRTVPQAEELARVMEERGIVLDRVINFRVSRDAVVTRLSGRRSCPKCQATFHVEFAPSQKGALCDRCGEPLIQRNDDKPEAIEMRLKVYEEQTAPLISFYERKKVLSHLDGTGAVEVVYQNLTNLLAALKMA